MDQPILAQRILHHPLPGGAASYLMSLLQYQTYSGLVTIVGSRFLQKIEFFLLTLFGCRNSFNLNVVRSRPVHLKHRVPLGNREPKFGLEHAAAPPVDFNADILAIEENPDLLPYLISAVEKDLGSTCQLAHSGSAATG